MRLATISVSSSSEIGTSSPSLSGMRITSADLGRACGGGTGVDNGGGIGGGGGGAAEAGGGGGGEPSSLLFGFVAAGQDDEEEEEGEVDDDDAAGGAAAATTSGVDAGGDATSAPHGAPSDGVFGDASDGCGVVESETTTGEGVRGEMVVRGSGEMVVVVVVLGGVNVMAVGMCSVAAVGLNDDEGAKVEADGGEEVADLGGGSRSIGARNVMGDSGGDVAVAVAVAVAAPAAVTMPALLSTDSVSESGGRVLRVGAHESVEVLPELVADEAVEVEVESEGEANDEDREPCGTGGDAMGESMLRSRGCAAPPPPPPPRAAMALEASVMPMAASSAGSNSSRLSSAAAAAVAESEFLRASLISDVSMRMPARRPVPPRLLPPGPTPLVAPRLPLASAAASTRSISASVRVACFSARAGSVAVAVVVVVVATACGTTTRPKSWSKVVWPMRSSPPSLMIDCARWMVPRCSKA